MHQADDRHDIFKFALELVPPFSLSAGSALDALHQVAHFVVSHPFLHSKRAQSKVLKLL